MLKLKKYSMEKITYNFTTQTTTVKNLKFSPPDFCLYLNNRDVTAYTSSKTVGT